MSDVNLTSQQTHFAFGKNWAAYAEKITESEITEADNGLARLLGTRDIAGKRFLDIGSGSGLHSLSALRLGAGEVVSLDIDPDSVATTRAVLERHAPNLRWQAQQESVFNVAPSVFGTFDIVYSWGVLHHTGDMYRAIEHSARLVGDGGLFVFALYRRIWMDWFWGWEKRWYANASPVAQSRARAIHRTLFRGGLLFTGRSFTKYIATYRGNRGMDFSHDVHDWLGGWPYESISTPEVKKLMDGLGFEPLRVFARKGRLLGRDPGLFGSGCDEYVYRRRN